MHCSWAEVLIYKRIENRTKPVATTMPEECHIKRYPHPKPLEGMPELPKVPPKFVLGKRYTQKRRDKMNVDPANFLWPQERELVYQFTLLHKTAFAWDETEKGSFLQKYFLAIKIPVIEHMPWVDRSIPIPPGIQPKVMQHLQDKIASGIYNLSNLSYRSGWFCVPKSNGKIRIVHNLQPLNRVTVKDAAVPPFTEHTAEAFGGCGCYGMLDLFVAFDQHALDKSSHNLTTF